MSHEQILDIVFKDDDEFRLPASFGIFAVPTFTVTPDAFITSTAFGVDLLKLIWVDCCTIVADHRDGGEYITVVQIPVFMSRLGVHSREKCEERYHEENHHPRGQRPVRDLWTTRKKS